MVKVHVAKKLRSDEKTWRNLPAAVGGAALISKSIKKYEVLAYPELDPRQLQPFEVVDFPAIVVIDSEAIITMKKVKTLS